MFAWCNIAIRAQPLAYGADDHVHLELYLAWCGRGLPVETPGVRQRRHGVGLRTPHPIGILWFVRLSYLLAN